MLAHHYSSALELARAAGADTTALEEPARRAFHEAGDRAYALSAYQTARGFYAAALEVWPEDEPPSPELLIRYGRILNSVDLGGQPEILTGAVEAARATGNSGLAAEAETLMCEMYWLQGLRDEGFAHLRAAEELVEDEPSSYGKAYVMTNSSRFWMLAGEGEHAIRVGREALAMAEELGLEELQAHALDNIGVARIGLGDNGGIADLERSIEIADRINSIESARAYGNLASALDDLGQLERSWELLREGRLRAERFGLDDWLLWLRGESAWPPYYSGRWDEALRVVDDLIEDFMTHRFWMESPCRVLRSRMRLATGDEQGAREDAGRGLELARDAKDPQVLWPALASSARGLLLVDLQRAEQLVDELLRSGRAAGCRCGARATGSPTASSPSSPRVAPTRSSASIRSSKRRGTAPLSHMPRTILWLRQRSTERLEPSRKRPTLGCALPSCWCRTVAAPRRMPSSSGPSRSGERLVPRRSSVRARPLWLKAPSEVERADGEPGVEVEPVRVDAVWPEPGIQV